MPEMTTRTVTGGRVEAVSTLLDSRAVGKYPPSKRRLSTARRGYGKVHRLLRRAWASRVARGGVMCVRCERPIHPSEPWDLGHDDFDRSRYSGPEHRRCNRATAGRKKTSRAW